MENLSLAASGLRLLAPQECEMPVVGCWAPIGRPTGDGVRAAIGLSSVGCLPGKTEMTLPYSGSQVSNNCTEKGFCLEVAGSPDSEYTQDR